MATPADVDALEACSVEIESFEVSMAEYDEADHETPPVYHYYNMQEVEEGDTDTPELEVSMADFDPYYSETESDLITEEGEDVDAPWVTGDGPAMYTFPYFDDFVVYYRIYSPTDAIWFAWNAAQDFDVEEFEEPVPDLEEDTD